MCKCGCNTCDTKPQGPLLTEGKVKSLLSEGLQYHIDKKIPLFETVYRIGSDKHLSLIKEARKMYSRNVIDLCEEDEHLIRTHIGEFALYEGETVPLDLPMLNEDRKYLRESKFLDIYGTNSDGEKTLDLDKIKNILLQNQEKINSSQFNFIQALEEYLMELESFSPEDGYENVTLYDLIRDFEGYSKEALLEETSIDEAEFKGKDVPLNKPKRGGSKAYYVYVKDPKTKKVKKVSFGSGGLRAKIKNKEARNAFAKRHNCDQKKDRTKAGYWSCNLPRYASLLGLGANMNTYW